MFEVSLKIPAYVTIRTNEAPYFRWYWAPFDRYVSFVTDNLDKIGNCLSRAFVSDVRGLVVSTFPWKQDIAAFAAEVTEIEGTPLPPPFLRDDTPRFTRNKTLLVRRLTCSAEQLLYPVVFL